MGRINNIRDLEFEKLKLKVRQLELEKRMNSSWNHLVRQLSSAQVKQEKVSGQSGANFKTSNPLLSVALNYGTSFLSHKLGLLAGKKIEGLAERALETLSHKISAAVSKQKRA